MEQGGGQHRGGGGGRDDGIGGDNKRLKRDGGGLPHGVGGMGRSNGPGMSRCELFFVPPGLFFLVFFFFCHRNSEHWFQVVPFDRFALLLLLLLLLLWIVVVCCRRFVALNVNLPLPRGASSPLLRPFRCFRAFVLRVCFSLMLSLCCVFSPARVFRFSPAVSFISFISCIPTRDSFLFQAIRDERGTDVRRPAGPQGPPRLGRSHGTGGPDPEQPRRERGQQHQQQHAGVL